MTDFTFLTGLDWPAAFTIVGSVVALMGGTLAMYVNYLRARNGTHAGTRLTSQLPTSENIQIHDRISGLRDRVSGIEGEEKVTRKEIENVLTQLGHIRKGMKDHEDRDRDDFKTINTKVDRLMEIIVEMLKDDH